MKNKTKIENLKEVNKNLKKIFENDGFTEFGFIQNASFFVNIDYCKVKFIIDYHKNDSNKFYLITNLNNRFEREFDFNNVEDLIIFVKNYNLKKLEELKYL